MNITVLSLLILLVAINIAWCGKKQTITAGKFKYNGAVCDWDELGKKNSHDRSLRINCPGQKKTKKQEQRDPLKCIYEGDPHEDDWYNKNQAKFYMCLISTMAKEGTLCTASTVECKGVDVVFELKQHSLTYIAIMGLESDEVENDDTYEPIFEEDEDDSMFVAYV